MNEDAVELVIGKLGTTVFLQFLAVMFLQLAFEIGFEVGFLFDINVLVVHVLEGLDQTFFKRVF